MNRSLVNPLVEITLVTLISVAFASPGLGQIVLLDTFTDDTVGQPPNGPEIGTYSGLVGTNSVVDVASDLKLRMSSMTPNGSNLRWNVIGVPTGRVRFSYEILIESGSTLLAINALGQGVRLGTSSGGGSGVTLEWGNDMMWRIGSTSSVTVGSFVFDRLYTIVWIVDTASDTYALTIDGQPIASGGLPNDPSEVSWLAMTANTGTSASWLVDDIGATIEPYFTDDFETGDTSRWSSTIPLPTGNECGEARTLVEGVTLFGDLSDNTGSTGDDSSCGVGDTIDEWLETTASCTGELTVTTCFAETEFDTVLSAYDTCGGNEVACNDDDPAGSVPVCALNGLNRKSTLFLSVTSGATYRIRVSAFGDGFPTPDETGYAVWSTCTPN